MPETIFTKIINREIPAKIHYEDDNFIAFDDKFPSAPVDVLIVTKHPFPTLQSISSDDKDTLAGLFQTVKKVAEQLGIADNYRLVVNVGEEMQLVKHVHIHLMGGWSKEKLAQVKQTNI